MAETPINHKEAWDLACFRRDESNLARCYIDAVELLRKARLRLLNTELGYDVVKIADAADSVGFAPTVTGKP